MTLRSALKRATVVTAGATALVLAGTTSASAWHCFVPMYSLNGPTSSANWFVVSAELGAQFEAEYTTACDAARDAGYAALHEAGLPVGIKIFEKMTLGESVNGNGQGAANNPNGANGKGLEYFGHGSGLPVEMVMTYIGGAESVDCG
ncbi:MAG TPA: hypothetical protein VFZ64_10100 [Nocardioidaceae bacterium]